MRQDFRLSVFAHVWSVLLSPFHKKQHLHGHCGIATYSGHCGIATYRPCPILSPLELGPHVANTFRMHVEYLQTARRSSLKDLVFQHRQLLTAYTAQLLEPSGNNNKSKNRKLLYRTHKSELEAQKRNRACCLERKITQ